jgi:hypothetical protein
VLSVLGIKPLEIFTRQIKSSDSSKENIISLIEGLRPAIRQVI